MEQHRCRMCLQYSTETISIHDQIAAGVTYLDTTLKPTDQLELDGPSDELLHICVPCANMTETAYNFKESCEEDDYKLEITEEIIIEEKVKTVEIENDNVIAFTSKRCKSEEEDNDVKLLNKIKVEPIDENIRLPSDLDGVIINSSDFEIVVKTENVTSNCSAFSLKQVSNIANENEQTRETSVKNNYDLIEVPIDIHRCKLCDKTYNLRDSLRRHVKNVHKLVKLPCDYCEYIPESASDYVKHTKAKHADKVDKKESFFEFVTPKGHLLTHGTKNYVCKLCGSKFSSSKNLKSHLKRHERGMRQVRQIGFACKICDKKFSSTVSLRNHSKLVHNSHDKSCYFCSFLPKSRDELSKHLTQAHADKKSLACKDCGKTYLDQRYLNKHLLVHEQKKHMCNICGDEFCSKHKLKNHAANHTGEKRFSCCKCDTTFRYSTSFKRHMKNHSEKENIGNSVAQEIRDLYVCEICNKKYTRRRTLRKHNEEVHGDKKNLACNQCDKSFFEVEKLNAHLRVHDTNNHVCKICDYKCSQHYLLIRHMSKHSEERPFQCSNCDKTFKYSRGLNSHLQTQNCKIAVRSNFGGT